MMKDFLLFLGATVLAKVISDSLPVIGIKELRVYFLRVFVYLTCMGFVLLIVARLYLISGGKVTKQQQLSAGLLMVLALAVLVWYTLYSRQLKNKKTPST